MKFNKKGQAITNPYTIIFIVVIMGIFSLSWLDFGRDLAEDPESNLNDESRAFIFNQAGYTLNTSKSTGDTTDTFFTSETENEGNLKDFALEFQFYREQSSGIRQIFQDIWFMPTFLVSNFGLDVNDWDGVLAIINTLVWAIILFGIYGFLRGKF